MRVYPLLHPIRRIHGMFGCWPLRVCTTLLVSDTHYVQYCAAGSCIDSVRAFASALQRCLPQLEFRTVYFRSALAFRELVFDPDIARVAQIRLALTLCPEKSLGRNNGFGCPLWNSTFSREVLISPQSTRSRTCVHLVPRPSRRCWSWSRLSGAVIKAATHSIPCSDARRRKGVGVSARKRTLLYFGIQSHLWYIAMSTARFMQRLGPARGRVCVVLFCISWFIIYVRRCIMYAFACTNATRWTASGRTSMRRTVDLGHRGQPPWQNTMTKLPCMAHIFAGAIQWVHNYFK